MNTVSENGFQGVAQIPGSGEAPSVQTPANPSFSGKDPNRPPYVPQENKRRPWLKENTNVLLLGGAIIAVLVFFVLTHLPHPPAARPDAAGNSRPAAISDPNAPAGSSTLPLIEAERKPDPEPDASKVGPEEIGRTATHPTNEITASSLGGIRPFGNPSWEPPPYQPGAPLAPEPIGNDAGALAESKTEQNVMDKASLVFVRSNSSPSANFSAGRGLAAVSPGIGLPPGTRLRARLESAVSTAVQTPVVAVIEYNYEREGEILAPAGAKVFGQLEAADRSGIVGVRFESMMMPDGSSLSLEATATDLELRPLRGKVEGKHTGQNVLVRSFAGLGEVAATLAGRGSLNQPLSEGDLLRERATGNIAQSSDEEVNMLALSEHLVVSVPAGTEIYVILQKPARTGREEGLSPNPSSSKPGVEQLREVMQLQKELNQTASPPPSNP